MSAASDNFDAVHDDSDFLDYDYFHDPDNCDDCLDASGYDDDYEFVDDYDNCAGEFNDHDYED